MRSSSAGVFPFFAISISGLSLPPSLSLINPDLSSSSNHLNQTFSGLTSVPGTTCTRAHGEDMSVASCNNAWQKIHRSSHSHRFIPRRDVHDASPNDMIVPIRYLSDDGNCAIVRCPISFCAFILFHSGFAKLLSMLQGQVIFYIICKICRKPANLIEEPMLIVKPSFRTSHSNAPPSVMKLLAI